MFDLCGGGLVLVVLASPRFRTMYNLRCGIGGNIMVTGWGVAVDVGSAVERILLVMTALVC